MGSLQRIFDEYLATQASPERVIYSIAVKKLEKKGAYLTKSFRKHIEEEIAKSLADPDHKIQIDEKRIRRYNRHLPSDFNWSINVTSKDVEAYGKKVRRAIEKAIPETVKTSSEIIYKSFRANRRITLATIEDRRSVFERRLQQFWRVPIETLDIFIDAAQLAGSEFNEEHRDEAVRYKDFTFEALVRLHARACKTAQEILALIRAGFADGANARWRTMHEVLVVAAFLAEHDKDVANRYLLHQHADSYRAGLQLNEFHRRLGYTKIPAKEMRNRKAVLDRLTQQFGDEYKNDYGWAATALGKKNPRFSEIESSIRMSHWRPHYKLASQSVHAGPRAAYFSLGLMGDTDRMLAGASNTGFADPAKSAAFTLLQITGLLLHSKPTIDSLAMISVLTKMATGVADAFSKKQMRLEELERQKQMNR